MSEFLSASHHAALSLRRLAVAPASEKAAIESAHVWPVVDRVNRALVAVEINDSDALADAVRAVDRALVVLTHEARVRTFTGDEWTTRRDAVISNLPDLAKSVARSEAHG